MRIISVHITTISVKQQITIPKQLLKSLGVDKKDKLLLDVSEGRLVAEPIGESIINQITGSVSIPKNKKGKSIKEIMAVTKKNVARQLANT